MWAFIDGLVRSCRINTRVPKLATSASHAPESRDRLPRSKKDVPVGGVPVFASASEMLHASPSRLYMDVDARGRTRQQLRDRHWNFESRHHISVSVHVRAGRLPAALTSIWSLPRLDTVLLAICAVLLNRIRANTRRVSSAYLVERRCARLREVVLVTSLSMPEALH